jgi:hypothetical protein
MIDGVGDTCNGARGDMHGPKALCRRAWRDARGRVPRDPLARRGRHDAAMDAGG